MRVRFRQPARVLANFSAAFMQAVPALYFAATLNVAAGYAGPLRNHYGSLEEKIGAALSPFFYLHDGVHVFALLCVVVAVLLLAGRLRFDKDLWPVVLAVTAAAFATPHVLASTWGTDLRFPLVAALLAIAALSVRIGRPGRVVAIAGLFGVIAIRSYDTWGALHSVDLQFAEMRSILTGLPSGSRLLSVSLNLHNTGRERVPINTQWHLPLVATIEHDAFLPLLFTGITTVRVREPYRRSSTPNGWPISLEQLRAGAVLDDSGAERDDGEGARFYHFGWPRKFDYVLINGSGADTGALARELLLQRRSRNLALYKVRADYGR